MKIDKRQSILEQKSLRKTLIIDRDIFDIDMEISRDSDSITYRARHDGEYGRLKEWFPSSAQESGISYLRHSKNNDLSFIFTSSQMKEENYEVIKDQKREFLLPYKLFHDGGIVPEKSPRIQIFMNDRDSDDKAIGSVYVWIPMNDPKTYTLKDYLDDLKLNYGIESEYKLRRLLKLLYQLIKTVKELNVLEDYSIKIRAENFIMPYDSQLRPLDTQLDLAELSFVRINQTVKSYVSHKISQILSDVLRLDEKTITKVDYSPLIQASSVNSNINIIQRITEIISKSESDAYTDLSELENELLDIIELSYELEKKTNYSTRLALENTKDEEYSAFYRKYAIANALFKYPFAQHDKRNSKTLIFGFSNSGQACADVFMQLGQTIGNTPNITVVTHSPYLESSKKFYLNARPDLKRFVKIEGQKFENPHNIEPYALMDFKAFPDIPFNDKDRFPNQEDVVTDPIVRARFEEFISGKEIYDSVVICLGNDQLNKDLAQMCKEILKEKGRSTQVYFTVNNSITPTEEDGAIPIYLSGETNEVHPVLEDLAFNMHYLWKDQRNGIDLNKLFEAFKEKSYHYTSSIISTLGIINNLEALNISANPFKGDSKKMSDTLVWEYFTDTAQKVSAILLNRRNRTSAELDQAFDNELRDFFKREVLEESLSLKILNERQLREKALLFYESFMSEQYRSSKEGEDQTGHKNKIISYCMRVMGWWIQEAIKNELQVYLHRNWLIGKVNNGWIAPLESDKKTIQTPEGERTILEVRYDEIIANILFINEVKEKIHPRIIPCHRDSSLSEHFKDHQSWDEIDQDHLDLLDPIDRYSIKFHETLNKTFEYLQGSKAVKEEAQRISTIRIYLSNLKIDDEWEKRKLLESFDTVVLTMKNIKNGSKNFQREFPFIVEEFFERLDRLDVYLSEDIIKSLIAILNIYWIRIKRDEYRDYKENNRLLVENLPFIFSNHWRKNIVQAFKKPRDRKKAQDLFSNLLPVLLYLPNQMTFLTTVEDEKEAEQMKEWIVGLSEFLEERRMSSKLGFRFYLNNPKQNAHLVKELEGISSLHERIEECLVINTTDTDQSVFDHFCDTLEDLREKGLLTYFNRAVPLFSYKKVRIPNNLSPEKKRKIKQEEKEKESKSQELQHRFDQLVQSKYKTFTFDNNDIRIKKSQTNALEYFKTDKLFLNIDEMLRLDNDDKFDFEEFYPDLIEEDDFLWSIYRGKIDDNTLHIPFTVPLERHKYFSEAWEDLCRRLKEKDSIQIEEQSIEINIPDNASEREPILTRRYLPDFSYYAAKDLLDILKDNEATSSSASIQKWTFDSCCLSLSDDFLDSGQKEQFENIFFNPYHLTDSAQIRSYSTGNKPDSFRLVYDDLHCKELYFDEQSFYAINTPYNLFRAEADILRLLFDKGMILKPTGYTKGQNKKLSIYEARINTQWNFYYATLKIKRLLTNPRMIVIAHLFYDATRNGDFDDVSGVTIKAVIDGKVEEIPCLILTKGMETYFIYYQHNFEEKKKSQKTLDIIKSFADRKLINYQGLVLTSPSIATSDLNLNGFKMMNVEEYDDQIERIMQKFKEK